MIASREEGLGFLIYHSLSTAADASLATSSRRPPDVAAGEKLRHTQY